MLLRFLQEDWNYECECLKETECAFLDVFNSQNYTVGFDVSKWYSVLKLLFIFTSLCKQVVLF